MKRINIAIDGPAGAGKSTIAKRIAKEHHMLYMDTGALYRTLAFCVLSNRVDPRDEDAVEEICRPINVRILFTEGMQRVLLDEKDVTDKLRTEEIGNAASIISAYPYIRKKLLSIQRQTAADEDLIMDGRDIGSFVLPDAGLKIYLTASSKVRAKRRFDELTQNGQTADFSRIKEDIEKRDMQDKTREIAPLVQAEDAVLVDSSDMTVDEVVLYIVRLMKERWNI